MESLGIDFKLLIAQIINFGLFFFIFKRFIAKPFSIFLNIEVQKEKEKEKILQDLKKKEEALDLEQKKTREKMKSEFDEALKNAKIESQKLKEQLLIEAKKEADSIIGRGRKQTEEEKKTMHKEMKEQIVDLSLLIVNKALNRFLTQDEQKTITQNILKNFPKDIN